MTTKLSPEIEAQILKEEAARRESMKIVIAMTVEELETADQVWKDHVGSFRVSIKEAEAAGKDAAEVVEQFIRQHEADGSLNDAAAVEFALKAYAVEKSKNLPGLAVAIMQDYIDSPASHVMVEYWIYRAGVVVSGFQAQAARKEAQKKLDARIARVIKAGHTPCRKCGGTGLFIMWIENGIPRSTTGTTCWRCGGNGVEPEK